MSKEFSFFYEKISLTFDSNFHLKTCSGVTQNYFKRLSEAKRDLLKLEITKFLLGIKSSWDERSSSIILFSDEKGKIFKFLLLSHYKFSDFNLSKNWMPSWQFYSAWQMFVSMTNDKKEKVTCSVCRVTDLGW